MKLTLLKKYQKLFTSDSFLDECSVYSHFEFKLKKYNINDIQNSNNEKTQ